MRVRVLPERNFHARLAGLPVAQLGDPRVPVKRAHEAHEIGEWRARHRGREDIRAGRQVGCLVAAPGVADQPHRVRVGDAHVHGFRHRGTHGFQRAHPRFPRAVHDVGQQHRVPVLGPGGVVVVVALAGRAEGVHLGGQHLVGVDDRGHRAPGVIVGGVEEDELQVAAALAHEVDQAGVPPCHFRDERVDVGDLDRVREVVPRDEVVGRVVEGHGPVDHDIGTVRAAESEHLGVLQDERLDRVPVAGKPRIAALFRALVVEGEIGSGVGIDPGLVVVLGEAGHTVGDAGLDTAREPRAPGSVGRHTPDVVLAVQQDRFVVFQPGAGAEAVRGDQVGGGVVLGVRKVFR